MGLITYTPIADGTGIDVLDINTPFTSVYNEINGNLDANNLKDNAVTTGKITNDAVTGAKIQLNNNDALTALNAASTAKDLMKLGTDDYLRISQLPYQSITTNSTQENVLIQAGWSFINNDGTEASTKAITFPVAYTTVLGVFLTPAGQLAGSDPTVLTGLTLAAPVDAAQLTTATTGLSTTGFTAVVKRTAASSGERTAFSWIAIGTK